ARGVWAIKMDNTSDTTPAAEPIAEPPSLDQRLDRLSDVDRKISDVLAVSREVLQNFDKERQISKTKMDDMYKRYSKCLEEIEAIVSDEFVYMEFVSLNFSRPLCQSGECEY